METKIKSLFSSYYYRLREEDIIVKELNKREFAIWEFNSDTLTRHLAFENPLNLKKELIKRFLCMYIIQQQYMNFLQ
jgi:DNA primase catalytic subunit